jgi:hypothetical protein
MSTNEALKKLREPFADHHISQLPKPYKKDSPKGTCPECKGYHGLPAMHLDYVGHAALTDRLLDTDETWNWEPLAKDADGLPKLDRDGGLWIRLTVCGVTRLGYGDAGDKTGANAMKERIGDALRNAGMRFGAALDLWHKGELHSEEESEKKPAKPSKSAKRETQAPPTVEENQAEKLPEVVGVVEDISANEKGTWYKIGAEICTTANSVLIAKLSGTHGERVRLAVASQKLNGKINVIVNVLEVGEPVEEPSPQRTQEEADSIVAAAEAQSDVAFNDETGRAVGIIKKIYPASGKGPLNLIATCGSVDINFSTFSKTLMKRLDHGEGKRIVVAYTTTSKDGKQYRNLTDIEKVGEIDFTEAA